MSQALPPDLINPSIPELNRASDNDVNFTNSEELHRFWKVYEAQRDYVDDPSVPRLRNLFWRIWSSDSLARSISNERLNQLWLRCRRDDPVTSFNISPSFLRRYGIDRARRLSNSGARESARAVNDRRARSSAPPSPLDEFPSFPQRSKQYSAGYAQPTLTGSGDHGSHSTESTESSNRPGNGRTTSGGRSRPPFVASGGRGRARPSVLRRKSSQSRGQQPIVSRPLQPPVRSPNQRFGSNEDQGASARATNIADGQPAFTLPAASSWQSVDDSSPRPASPTGEASIDKTGSLVDPNFRSRFLSSATNLPAMGRMRKTGSVVRFADEEEDMGKGKAKDASPPRNPEQIRSRGRTSSQVFESDESDEMELPRTKSQLSMAIQDRRKQSGSRDLGLGPVVEQQPGRSSEARRREEELLTMGRRAAAPQIPKTGRGSGRGERYRSPSPGPTF